jgi:hypothetical protein
LDAATRRPEIMMGTSSSVLRRDQHTTGIGGEKGD